MEKQDFGKKLIEVRRAKGLTQEEVAEMCNVVVRTIQRIESGRVEPRASTIKIISEALGFDFFETSNTGYDVVKEPKNSNQLKHTILWYGKDLFNLKTNAMKKISILTACFLMLTMAVYALVPTPTRKTNIQLLKEKKRPHCLISKDKVDVLFTNKLTFDSLVVIKNQLKDIGITLDYQKLAFDNNNQLLSIDCKVYYDDNSSGSFSAPLLDEDSAPGFYYNNSANAKVPFAIGDVFD